MRLNLISILFVGIIHILLLFYFPEGKKDIPQLEINTHTPSVKVSLRASVATPSQKGDGRKTPFAKNRSQSQIIAEAIKTQGLINKYLQGLSSKIQNELIYPTLSKRLKERGKVTVEFVINKNGTFSSIGIVKQSSFKRLDSAAISTLKQMRSYLPIPDQFKKELLKVTQTIDFI